MKKKKLKLISRGEPIIAMPSPGPGGGCNTPLMKRGDCPDITTQSPPHCSQLANGGRSSGGGDDIGPMKPF